MLQWPDVLVERQNLTRNVFLTFYAVDINFLNGFENNKCLQKVIWVIQYLV